MHGKMHEKISRETFLNTNKKGGKVVVTLDSGAGSSGKGAFNSWLGDKYTFHYATNNWMPNAGHYTELDNGTRILVQHIPSSFINPNIILYINAGAAINITTLFDEIQRIENLGFEIKDRLFIHPNANVIIQEDIETEKRLIKSGSTFKGCGAAQAGKILRQGRKLAKDYEELTEFIDDKTVELNESLTKGASILIEGAQGIDLDINHAEFPYCTSRQTHPTQLVADAGLAPQTITNVIANARTNPIRINNVSAADNKEICYTGNYWDAKEISWEIVAKRAGYESFDEFMNKYSKSLLTSVTKKVRRVFEFPKQRANYVHALCGGLMNDGVLLYSLNFINFVDKNVDGVTTIEELMTDKVKNWLNEYMYSMPNMNLKWIRTGAKHSQIVELP
jgi:hypothetical protein